jgi:hypothetical protein
VLDNTHGVLVKCEVKEVFLGEFKEWVSVYNGEQANDFLDKMGSVRMTRQLEKVFLHTLAHKFVLFVIGKELDKGLNGMRTLLVSDNVGDIFVEALHDFEPLSVIADAEKFLDHVICVFVGD